MDTVEACAREIERRLRTWAAELSEVVAEQWWIPLLFSWIAEDGVEPSADDKGAMAFLLEICREELGKQPTVRSFLQVALLALTVGEVEEGRSAFLQSIEHAKRRGGPLPEVESVLGSLAQELLEMRTVSRRNVRSKPAGEPGSDDRGDGREQGDGGWTTAGGNNRRTGAVKAPIRPPLEQLWCAKEVRSPMGGLAISNGIAVCGEYRRGETGSRIHAVSMADGAGIWSVPMHGIVMGCPTIDGGYVYTGSSSCALCLELGTGKEVWRTSQDAPSSAGIPIATVGCPLCIAELVVYRDEEIRAFHALTGEEVFSLEGSDDPRENVGPCADEEYLYLPGHRTMLCVDLDTYKVVAQVHTDGKVNAGPILADGLLVYSSNRGTIEALAAQSLDTVWSFRIEDPELHSIGMDSACAYSKGMLYVGGLDGNLYALDAKTGNRVWKYQTGEAVEKSPVVCGDVVFLNAHGTDLCGLDAATGKLLCKVPLHKEQDHRGLTGLAVSGSVILAGGDRLCAFTSAGR